MPLKRIGEGGSGVVFLAHDRQREAVVALKTLAGLKPTSLFRFKQEFRGLADIHHPNLVRLHELVEQEGAWFFTMDFVEGQPFDKYLKTNRNVGDLRRILQQVAKGVHALHRGGKLHRDLKPENVLITTDGTPVILDFGLVMDERRMTHETIDDGWVEGTPAFMSPEQALGDPLTAASDWYAFGTMMYDAFSGKLPFHAPYPQILSLKVDQDPPPITTFCPELPKDLTKLIESLLDRDPSRRPRGEDIVQVLRKDRPPSVQLTVDQIFGSQGSGQFVGREQHVDALNSALKATDSGRPAVVFVSGAAGMGKTTLVDHFLEGMARASDAVVLRGRCYERESVPLKALDSLVDDLCRYLRRMDPVKLARVLPRQPQALARLFPVLERVDAFAEAPVRNAPPADPKSVRDDAVATLKELLGRIADEQPLILFIDDLQWGDEDSAAVLASLLGEGDAPAIMLIGAYRSDEQQEGPCMRRLRRLGLQLGAAAQTLDVAPLTDAQAGELLAAMSRGMQGLDVQKVAEEAKGSPHFITELLRLARDRQVSTSPSDRPPTMKELVSARLDTLTPSSRELVEMMALANRPMSLELLRLCLPQNADVHAALGELRTQRLIRVAGGEGTDGVQLQHNLTGETISAQLSAEQVREYHLNIADALELEGSPDLEALTLHLVGAGQPQRAMPYALRGAQQAEASGANNQAVRLYRLAVEHRPEGRAKNELRLALGRVLSNAGRPGDAAQVFLEAADAVDENEAERWSTLGAIALLTDGRKDAGLALLGPTLEAQGYTLPRSGAGSAQLTKELWGKVRKRGLDYSPRADAQLQPRDLERLDMTWEILRANFQPDAHQLRALVPHHLLDALNVGETGRVARALCLFHRATDTILCQQEGVHSLGALELAGRLATGRGDAYLDGCVMHTEASSAFLQGNWQAAVELSRLAISQFERRCVGCVPERTVASMVLVTCHMMEGRWSDAYRAVRAMESVSEANALMARFAFTPNVSLLRDDPAKAAEDLLNLRHVADRSTQLLRMTQFAAGSVARYTDDAPACRANADELGALLSSSGISVRAYRAIALWARQASMLAAAKLEGYDESAGIQQCLDELEAQELPWFDASVVVGRAALAHLRGETDRAVSMLEGAVGLLQGTERELLARLRLGKLTGGQAGEHMQATAEYALQEAGIDNPQRFAAIFIPGF